MIFLSRKQRGVIIVFPLLWAAVAIGFVSVKFLKNNDSTSPESSIETQSYKNKDATNNINRLGEK